MEELDYFAIRHPDSNAGSSRHCYLCDQPLRQPLSSDHIIPDSIFAPNSPSRPQLSVHDSCHRLKSKDDRYFVRMLQMMSAFNSEADTKFGELIDQAALEQQNAWIIGKSKRLPNYKFAKTLTNGITWGFDIISHGQTYHQMKISERNIKRFESYAALMAKGLFIRNVPTSNPRTPAIFTIQYATAELSGDGKVTFETARRLMEQSTATTFAQHWGDRVSYFGSRSTDSANHGYLYIHFYHQYGILAAFTSKI